jgi:hypothetical protein
VQGFPPVLLHWGLLASRWVFRWVLCANKLG